jgi:hypothetical protein
MPRISQPKVFRNKDTPATAKRNCSKATNAAEK